MQTIIGLGNGGCNIASLFSNYDQYYDVRLIDTDEREGNFFHLPTCSSMERYETKCPVRKISNFLSNVNQEVFLITTGSGAINGALLRILSTIKNKNITVLYVRPNLEFLSLTKIQQEKLVYNVLQQYARSGKLERVFLFSNSQIINLLGDFLITSYYDIINKTIVDTFHMINVFIHNKPVFGSIDIPYETCRVGVLSIVDPSSMEEKSFFPVDKLQQKFYIYLMSEKQLSSDKQLFHRITEQIKKGNNVSCAVYETKYEQPYVYCVGYTSLIQP